MKIGILGSGQVAKVLGNGFLKYGNQVMLGTRDVTKLQDWKNESGEMGNVGSFEDAADYGDILVLAVAGRAAKDVLHAVGENRISGKTIIDVTNPIENAPPQNGVLKFFTSLDESLMEQLQNQFPAAHFVKSFSCVGSAYMVNPDFKEGNPTMFICGNNEQAKLQVKSILDQFGWETEDMGKVEASRAIEPLCILWCIPGFLNNQWSHAFRLLKK